MSGSCNFSGNGKAVLLLACLSFCSQFLLAIGGSSLSPEACSLRVSHGQNPLVHEYSTSVTLVNKNTGKEQSCYDLDTDYYIRLSTDAPTIKGFLMIQDRNKAYGVFGDLAANNKPLNMGYNLCHRMMIPSVCHDCGDEICDFGKSLDIPYKSPNARNMLEFRYSVVFEYRKFLQNQSARFPPCRTGTQPTEVPTEVKPTTPSKPTTSSKPPVVCNSTDFNLDHKPQPASTTCSNNVTFISNIVHKDGGQTYDCRYTDTRHSGQGVKRVDCFSGCKDDKTGKVLCCKVRIVQKVTRQFRCTSRTDANTISKLLDVIQERRCECFPCEDVCSAPTTESPTANPNSVEGEGSNSNLTNEIE